jgi:hypothetical protein
MVPRHHDQITTSRVCVFALTKSCLFDTLSLLKSFSYGPCIYPQLLGYSADHHPDFTDLFLLMCSAFICDCVNYDHVWIMV